MFFFTFMLFCIFRNIILSRITYNPNNNNNVLQNSVREENKIIKKKHFMSNSQQWKQSQKQDKVTYDLGGSGGSTTAVMSTLMEVSSTRMLYLILFVQVFSSVQISSTEGWLWAESCRDAGAKMEDKNIHVQGWGEDTLSLCVCVCVCRLFNAVMSWCGMQQGYRAVSCAAVQEQSRGGRGGRRATLM